MNIRNGDDNGSENQQQVPEAIEIPGDDEVKDEELSDNPYILSTT